MQRPPRTIRLRNALILAGLSLVVGFGIGLGGAKPAAAPAPSPTPVALATQAPAATPSATIASSGAASPSVAPTPTPTPTIAPTPAPPKPVVINGKGSQNTKRFTLAGGDYTVTIKGKPRDSFGGNVIVDLVSTDAGTSDNLWNEIARGSGTYTYSTNLYGVAPGSYYLEAKPMPGGTWTITFTPQ